MSAGAPETVYSTDEDGDTPLHHAARGGHVCVVRRLLALGADPTLRNHTSLTAAGEADGCRLVIEALVEAAKSWSGAEGQAIAGESDGTAD